MALTGIEIYKFLPKTNCKKCGFPTCLAFAMKVAQKTVNITTCPDLSAESRAALEAAGRPPIQLVTLGSDSKKLEVGNETVMFRHEKTFFHPPGLVLRVKDNAPADSLQQQVQAAAEYKVERVGRFLTMDGFAVENTSKDAATFAKAVEAVKSKSDLPLVLISQDPAAMEAALAKATPGRPLIYAANKDNWEKMADLAVKNKCPLAVSSNGALDDLTALVDQVSKKGIEEIVLDPGARDFGPSLSTLTQIRRLALKKNFRPLGYPVITFPGEAAASLDTEAMLAAQQVAKYAGIIVLDHFSPALVYPLLTMRLNIYTDPQKPIQVTPQIVQIGTPKATSPVCITTNFSLTYFAIAGELEAAGWAAWLVVCDTEGLSVLTAWAAGKFDAEKIAKSVKNFKIADNVSHRNVVIPGHVAVLRGELEEELPDWKILVGPREAVDVGGFLKQNWKN
ncbi:MAG: acetyl-CoA decarbonylase/synthase complex subunit gamma [Chloroflexi bacterium]|nr:acetyl-CoA decarbonylase/synthase complex subunit gamma [Chloroflexota bacterium]